MYTREQGTVVKDAIFWILIQSDPTVKDSMYYNNNTLEISVSAFHAKNFSISLDNEDTTQGLSKTWRPMGPVGNSSYSRFECAITRNTHVLDERGVPWIWANDTWSINEAFTKFWMSELGQQSSKNKAVTVPTPQTLFRLYQAYMVSVNTWLSQPSPRKLSVWMPTVQFSTACLVMLLLLILLELWLTGNYWWFLRCNKKELESKCIPDGKIDWMIYNARLAEQFATENGNGIKISLKDRDCLRRASFGYILDLESQHAKLARVYTREEPVPVANPGTVRMTVPMEASHHKPPKIKVELKNQAYSKAGGDSSKTMRPSNSVGSCGGIESTMTGDSGSSQLVAQCDQGYQDDVLINQESLRTSSVTVGPPSSIRQVPSPKNSLYSVDPASRDTDHSATQLQ